MSLFIDEVEDEIERNAYEETYDSIYGIVSLNVNSSQTEQDVQWQDGEGNLPML